MKATCAWCKAEGAPADLGEREPLDDHEETHGLCQRHMAQFLGAARSRPSAGLELLVVVRRGDQSLYDYLVRQMADVSGVHVIVDRRYGERRLEARHVPAERRQGDRRQYRSAVQSIGCTFVRLGPAAAAARAV